MTGARMKAVHFIRHGCGPQECDCLPVCHPWACDAAVTTDGASVTCKNCLRIMEAEKKRKARRDSARIASHKAWADEARGFE